MFPYPPREHPVGFQLQHHLPVACPCSLPARDMPYPGPPDSMFGFQLETIVTVAPSGSLRLYHCRDLALQQRAQRGRMNVKLLFQIINQQQAPLRQTVWSDKAKLVWSDNNISTSNTAKRPGHGITTGKSLLAGKMHQEIFYALCWVFHRAHSLLPAKTLWL